MGDIFSIAELAARVYTAYKNAPHDYRHISEEVAALQGLIEGVEQRHKGTIIGSKDHCTGQKVLRSCRSVLEDLHGLIERYNGTSTSQVFNRVMLGSEDIATLRARLTSNAVMLNMFLQMFDIPTTVAIEHIMLISLS